MENHFTIYLLRHPKTKQIVWVGSSCRPFHRKATHKSIFKTKYSYCPIFEVIEVITNCEEAKRREAELIIKYRNESQPLLNISTYAKGKIPGKRIADDKNLREELTKEFKDFFEDKEF